MLSSLAEGADRIGAEAALDCGVSLIAVLPMPVAAYESDFETPESLEHFGRLLARASDTIVMPKPRGDSPAGAASHEAARNRCYERSGMYIALHCHVLVAMWDGFDSDRVGGTAQIVRFRQQGIEAPAENVPSFCRSDRSALDLPETGPVTHIVTPRSTAPSHIDGTAFAVRHLEPASRHSHAQFATVLRHFDDHNGDIESLRDPHLERATSAQLGPAALAANDPVLQTLRQRFAGADALAKRFQGRVLGSLVFFVVMALAALGCFEYYAHVEHVRSPLGTYVALLSLVWAAHYLVVKRYDWQGRFQDDRALAEALRVQYFWRLGGLCCNVADYYLRGQADELAWIRHASRVCNIGADAPAASADARAAIREFWLRGEATYSARKAAREARTLKRFRSAILACYGSGLIFAVAVFAFGRHLEENVMHWVIVAMAVAPATAALAGYVVEKRGFESHVQRSRVMAALYARATDAFDRVHGDGLAEQALLSEIGREALAENGDWVILHRERTIEPPKG